MPDFVQVALPLPIDKTFTYRIPPGQRDRARPGCRAVVPFGRQLLVGVLVGEGAGDLPEDQVRAIEELPDPQPLLSPEILELCRWVSLYYFCSWGEALKAALPAGHLTADKGIPLRWQEVILPAEGWSPAELAQKSRDLEKKAPLQARILHFTAFQPKRWAAPDLLAWTGASRSALKALLAAGILKSQRLQVKRYPTINALTARDEAPLPQPNLDQVKALEAISASLAAGEGKTFLLYGVTGSGKTLVYQKAIEEALELGGSALVLVPEISLTPQMVGRFRAHFGDRVGLQHSAMSAGERLDVWQGIRNGEFPVVLGARSAVFAPLTNLKLIVVDEEGDSSFKQNDPNPRYHARDVALVRAKMCGATAVLGSATPSMESFFNADQGRFNLLELPLRVDDIPPPELRFCMPPKVRQKVLGADLERAALARVQRGEQVILLQNRRGFFTYVFCPKCGYISRCRHCEVCLIFHRTAGSKSDLRCHICGYRTVPPESCPKCGSPLRYQGVGTQRVEDELARLIPAEKIVRLDLDTTGRKGAHHRILKGFADGEYAIMVGTKMVARGHDYPKVTLVGVVSADAELAFPDFRCDERAFVLLLQAAGRAGRSANSASPSEVLIQTWMLGHPILKLVKEGDYRSFYRREIELRRALNWPPCGWLILFSFSARKEERAHKSARQFLDFAQGRLKGVIWLGPTPAYRARLKDKFRYQVVLKAPRKARSVDSDLHLKLREVIRQFREEVSSSVHFTVDVDPVQLL